MQTHLSLPYEHRTDLPEGQFHEVRTPDALVARFLREYTDPGDAVFDPFAGFGTTLAVAERLDRVPFGLEYEPDRVEYVRDRVSAPEQVRQGSVLDLDPDRFPACEFAFTSPPFMARGMERDPFQNYGGRSTYEAYLDDCETAFERIAGVVSPGGRVVVSASNLRDGGEVTPLAWDLADRVSTVLDFDGEVVVAWEGEGNPDGEGTFGYGYDHSYCLVFTTPGA